MYDKVKQTIFIYNAFLKLHASLNRNLLIDRCTRLSFICLVVSCLSITFVLSAPSQKRLESADNDAQSKIKHLVQSSKTVDAFDEKWYEVDDDHEENENKPVPIKAQSTIPKSAAKKDFKTICEEKDASGKCRTAQSGEKQPDHLHGLEQLISSKHQLTEKEAAHVLEMITSMSNKLHECQKAENKPCADTHGKQIAEIEEKHTKERKYIKKKEHDDTKTAVKDSINQNDGSTGQNVPPAMNNPVTDSPPLVPNGGGITQASMKAPNPGPAEPNYLEGPPSNVNYNGGINSPMDKLIQKYPEGHWPEKGNEADVGNDIGSENATEAGKGETATTVQEEYYEDEDDFKGQDVTEAPNIHPLLNPKYLESIIKQEQSSPVKYDTSKNHHHVQEHVLPKKRSFSPFVKTKNFIGRNKIDF